MSSPFAIVIYLLIAMLLLYRFAYLPWKLRRDARIFGRICTSTARPCQLRVVGMGSELGTWLYCDDCKRAIFD